MKRIVTPSCVLASCPMCSGTASFWRLKCSMMWRGKMPDIIASWRYGEVWGSMERNFTLGEMKGGCVSSITLSLHPQMVSRGEYQGGQRIKGPITTQFCPVRMHNPRFAGPPTASPHAPPGLTPPRISLTSSPHIILTWDSSRLAIVFSMATRGVTSVWEMRIASLAGVWGGGCVGGVQAHAQGHSLDQWVDMLHRYERVGQWVDLRVPWPAHEGMQCRHVDGSVGPGLCSHTPAILRVDKGAGADLMPHLRPKGPLSLL